MKNTKSGFTLPELLIVVAIIAVLVAIAIPVFSAQLESSRQASDISNIRAAYAEATADALTQGGKDGVAETGIMKHTGVFDKLGEATIGNLDLKTSDANRIVKDYTVIVTVSAKDGSVSLGVGNGGRIAGTIATTEELGRAPTGSRLHPDWVNYRVNGNKLDLNVPSWGGYGGYVGRYRTIEAEYGVPMTFSDQFENDVDYYFKWDGARWYAVTKAGDAWEVATHN